MTIIRIQEQPQTAQPGAALLIFEHGVQYEIAVRDPFGDDPRKEEDLEWYFEEHLTFPFVEQVRARNAAQSIQAYGEALFEQLFTDAQALGMYRESCQHGLHTLQFEIAGSPTFHRLHWEALYDPELKVFLAQHAPLIRRNLVPQSFPAGLRSSPTIEVLVVVARPHGTRDVGYRTISHPLMEALEKLRQPVRVTLLRPGTYRALDAHLERVTREQGVGYYHIIHFDVHGGLLTYKQVEQQPQASSYLYRSRYGRQEIAPYEKEKAYLFLEGEGENQADPVEASELAHLLQKHKIPIVLLNACQSGKFIEGDEKESSLGSYLIRAGVQSVLTMAYSVTVSAAEEFMPILYQELFRTQSLLAALSAARRALANEKERRAYYQQTIELEDWLLPVLYQNQDVRLSFQPFTPPRKKQLSTRDLRNNTRPPRSQVMGLWGEIWISCRSKKSSCSSEGPC